MHFGRKIRQQFDLDFYKADGRQFVWLAGVLLVCFLLCAGFCGYAGISVWRIVELMLDPGSFAGSEESGNVYFQLVVTLIGAVVFTSFTINAIGNFLDRRMNAFKRGLVSYDFEDHILIIGANGMLANTLQTITSGQNSDGRDIVILTDKDVEGIRELAFASLPSHAEKKVYVLYGKRFEKSSLEDVRAVKASQIYLLGEDDEPMHDALNLECWRHLKELYAGSTRVIECCLVMDRLSTEYSFHYKSDSASCGNLRLIVVCSDENIAQRVLVDREYVDGIKYPALDRDGIGRDSEVGVHLVIAGMTQMAYAIAVTTSHMCHFPNYMTKGKRTRISFVMPDIRESMETFRGHYASLMDLSYAEYVRWQGEDRVVERSVPVSDFTGPDAGDGKGFIDVEWEFIDGSMDSEAVRTYLKECAVADGKSEYLTIAVCGQNSDENVDMSLHLPSEIYDKHIPVLVYQKSSGEVLRSASSSDRFSGVYPFGMECDCYDPQHRERLKRAKRISYLYEHAYDYAAMPDEEELNDMWFGMKYVFQRSNLYSANSIPAKLRSMGLSDSLSCETLTDDQVDMLSEMEHNRWNVERLLAGFRAFPYDKRMQYVQRFSDPDLKADARKEHELAKSERMQHKDIAPYNELLAASKDYDKVIVKNILDVIR